MSEKTVRRALGRGLASLIPDSTPQTTASSAVPGVSDLDAVRRIPIHEITPLPDQPRRSFRPEELEELAASIRRSGVLQPLLVRRAENGYMLIAGERRLRASQMAGLESVPARVLDVTEKEAYGIALVENLQREDLNAMEVARAYRKLMDEYDMRQEDIAAEVGKDRASVANYLRLLQLPLNVQQKVEEGVLSFGHARAVAGLDADSLKRLNWPRIMSGAVSVRELERQVAGLRSDASGAAAKKTSKPERSPQARLLEEQLQRRVGLRVSLEQKSKQAGRLVFEYASLDELQIVLDLLGIGNDQEL